MPSSESEQTKSTISPQTVEDAMWGYVDCRGKYTTGVVQRLTAVEGRINLLLVLVGFALGRSAWPDIMKFLLSTVSIASASTGHGQ